LGKCFSESFDHRPELVNGQPDFHDASYGMNG
jgi:hypothetical protein